MNPDAVVDVTSKVVQLMRVENELLEKRKHLQSKAILRQQRATTTTSALKQKRKKRKLEFVKQRVEITRKDLDTATKQWKENEQRFIVVRRKLHDRCKLKIEKSQTFCAGTEKYMEMQNTIQEEKEKLAKSRLELAKAQGSLAGKEIVLNSLEKRLKTLQDSKMLEEVGRV